MDNNTSNTAAPSVECRALFGLERLCAFVGESGSAHEQLKIMVDVAREKGGIIVVNHQVEAESVQRCFKVKAVGWKGAHNHPAASLIWTHAAIFEMLRSLTSVQNKTQRPAD